MKSNLPAVPKREVIAALVFLAFLFAGAIAIADCG